MTCFMGIDGGGSTLRVVVTDANLQPLAQVHRPQTANPSVIGREAAALIREAMAEALDLAERPEVAAVGIGVAGASAEHAADWLLEVVAAVLPDTRIIPASDIEIALVGAHGRREGVLLLAGTGSVAYGVNSQGEALQIGGWGYLLGDEGGGYWIGLQALRLCTAVHDQRIDVMTILPEQVYAALGVHTARDLIPWLYSQHPTPVAQVAGLAPLVLKTAAAGDTASLHIVGNAADYLAEQARHLMQRLGMTDAPVAFAGSLLEHRNPLSDRVRESLGLPEHPQPRYPPVIGAALLAKLQYTQERQTDAH